MNSFLEQRDMMCCVFKFLKPFDITNLTRVNKYIYESVYKKKYYKNCTINLILESLPKFFNINLNQWLMSFKLNLIFEDDFNQSVIIPDNVVGLTFGNRFNKHVIIPSSVVNLKFGTDFNQSVIIPSSVIKLEFGYWFNKAINFPDSIIDLKFGPRFKQKIHIPSGLDNLTIRNYFNVPNLSFINYFKIPSSVNLKYEHRK